MPKLRKCASAASRSAWPAGLAPPGSKKPDKAEPVLQQFLDRMKSDAVVFLPLAADGHVDETRDGAVVVFRHQERLVRQVLVRLAVPFLMPQDTDFELVLRDRIAVWQIGKLFVKEVRQDGCFVDFEVCDFLWWMKEASWPTTAC